MKKIIFVLYSFNLLLFTLFSYVFIDFNLPYLHFLYTGFFEKREIITFIYIFFISSLFCFYIFFIRKLNEKQLSLLDLKKLIIISICFLFLSYPAMLSYDIFNYIITAKTTFFYHENPYIIMPIEFSGDPLLFFTRAANKTALYGPSWISLTAIPYLSGFNNFLLILFNLKLFILLFYVGTLLTIWKISKNLFSVAIFALNPLVIIETMISSHNDIVLAFLSLFSFFLLTRKKILSAVLVFILSILIKYATVFLIPVFLYVVWKTFKKENINWQKVFFYSAILMFVIFFLSAFREEIYPWYAIWFFMFVTFLSKKKYLLYLSLSLTFGLLLRYIPFMLWGTYFGQTPYVKTILTFFPTTITFLYLLTQKRIHLSKIIK